MELHEYKRLYRLYKQIDTSDIDQMRIWFHSYPELTQRELAMAMGISRVRLLSMRAKYGVNKVAICEVEDALLYSRFIINHKSTAGVYRKPLTMPPGMTKPELRVWIVEQYNKGFGRDVIRRATGLYNLEITKIIRRACGRLRPNYESTESTNPCSSRKWLMKHYVNDKLSLRQCAKLANVVINTVSVWLARHGVEARTMVDTDVVIVDKKTIGDPPASPNS